LTAVSTHSVAEVITAKQMGADFVVFGPVFSTPGKGMPKGLKKLRAACYQAGDMPVLGIGGIDEANAAKIIDCGAAGFASIRALNDSKTLVRLAQVFLG
jgi:thiamine-phosphate pyrophosphorylase